MSVLKKVERYLRTTGKTAAWLGRRAANDPRLVFDLRNGRRAGPRMIARIEAVLECKR